MINLFELMRQAQGNPAEAMARQFGLSPPQAESAIDALLPAFAVAIQRQLQDPQAWPKLFQAFAAAQQQTMMAAATQAFGRPKEPQNDLVGALFGSNDIARQIAAQAAAVSGLSPNVLQQMQTDMAATLMAGIGKSFAEQGMATWANAMSGGTANPFAAFSDMMGRMMGAAPGPGASAAAGPGQTPMSDLFNPAAVGAMINQMLGGKPAEPEAPPPPPPPTSSELSLDALSRIVETGREVQDSQLKTMQQILDKMFSPEDPAAKA